MIFVRLVDGEGPVYWFGDAEFSGLSSECICDALGGGLYLGTTSSLSNYSFS